MRGQEAQGEDALSADEQALLDADRSNTEPVEAPDEPIDAPTGGDDAAIADEPIEDPAVAGDEPARKNATVPLHALHKERAAAKAADERAAAAEARHAAEQKRSQTLEERMNLLLQRIAPQQQPQQQAQEPEPAPLPPLDQDPVGHLMGRLGQLDQGIKQRDQILTVLAQAVAGQNQQHVQSQNSNALIVRADALEKEYAAQNPEYDEASKYLIEAQREELKAQGWTDIIEINKFMGKQAEILIDNALRRGENPASIIHKLAKIRGWKPTSNGDASIPAAPAAPTPDPVAVQQIQNISRGQEQARGLNGVPGQAATQMSANAVLAMDDDEFKKWYSTVKPAEKRRIMGT